MGFNNLLNLFMVWIMVFGIELCVDVYVEYRLNRFVLLLFFKVCVWCYGILRICVVIFMNELLVCFGVICFLFVGCNNNCFSRWFVLFFILLFRVFVNFSDMVLWRFGRWYGEIIIDNYIELIEVRIILLGSEF